MRNLQFARTVRDLRKSKQLTRRKLAEYSNIDPSYVTLIERDGYVPRPEKVSDLGRVLGDRTRILFAAGYVPPELSGEICRIAKDHTVRRLTPDLQFVVEQLLEMPPAVQRQARDVIAALISTCKPKRKRRTA